MGSGKGKPVRKASTTKTNQTFLEFKLFQIRWVVTFRHFLFTKYGIDLHLVNPSKSNRRLFRFF
jgi:hypothetical protein